MKRLDLLDVARFVAALSVVCFHYFFNGIANGKISTLQHVDGLSAVAKYGYLGVEFFLMISGYVIFFSSRNRSAADFAVSRALRLFPAFWTALLLTSGFAFFFADQAMAVQPMQFLANLTMLPELFGLDYVDGVYWTLTLELSFYALIFLFLFMGAGRRLEDCLLAWPLLIFILSTLLKLNLPFLAGYYSYFAAGCVLAIAKERAGWRTMAAVACSLLNCLMFSARRGLRVVEGYEFSPLVVAAAVVLFFGFFLFLNTDIGGNVRIAKAKLLGGLTYPLYLIHAHIGYMLLSHFADEDNKLVAIPATVFAVLSMAALMHHIVEKKLSGFWRGLFQNSVGTFLRWLQKKAARARDVVMGGAP